MRTPTPQSKAFAWYFAALKHGAGSPQAPIHADEPQCGYFRLKNGDDYLPAYIGIDSPTDESGELTGDETLVLKVKYPGNPVALDRPALEAWTWVAGHPVPYEYFKEAWETGKWPDEAPGANFQFADTLEGLTDQLETMLANAANFAKVETQVQADQAANLKDRIADVCKALEEMRVAEKKPHDDAAKAVQLKFRPWIEKAEDGVNFLRRALRPYLEKAAEAARAAVAVAAGEMAAQALDVKPKAGGMGGRRTSTRKEKIANIVDFEAALAAVKDQPEIREAVEKVVKRLVRAGASVPGVEVKEEVRVI